MRGHLGSGSSEEGQVARGPSGHDRVCLFLSLFRPCPLGGGGLSYLEVTKEGVRGKDGPARPVMRSRMEGKEAGMQGPGSERQLHRTQMGPSYLPGIRANGGLEGLKHLTESPGRE